MMILATIASLVLSTMTIEQACGEDNGCSIVNTSKYEKTFGIKNAHIGLIAFPILAILTIFELRKKNIYRKRLIQLGIIIGSAFAIYFLYLQFFVLNALCKYCLVIDVGVLISLGLIFIEEKQKK
jgi:uncharacterized membrane protein